MTFHHIGIAVENIERYYRKLLKPVFGIRKMPKIITDKIQKSKIAFVALSPHAKIELIEPMGNGPVSSLLSRKKGGIYHLSFTTKKFVKDYNKLRASGCLPITDIVPAVAFKNRRIVFFYTSSREIIELVEI